MSAYKHMWFAKRYETKFGDKVKHFMQKFGCEFEVAEWHIMRGKVVTRRGEGHLWISYQPPAGRLQVSQESIDMLAMLCDDIVGGNMNWWGTAVMKGATTFRVRGQIHKEAPRRGLQEDGLAYMLDILDGKQV